MWKRIRSSTGLRFFLSVVIPLVGLVLLRTVMVEGSALAVEEWVKGANSLNAATVSVVTPLGGELTYVEMQKDGIGGVDGLDAARSVAVSPDGKHVYVASGGSDNAVAVFSRSPITGGLTYIEMKQDGVGGVDGLWGAKSVAVSPDGHHVYVASTGDNAVAVFERNPSTGVLTYVEMQQDGAGGVDGLGAALSVAVSPDGDHVYAVGFVDDAVAVFRRSVITGGLTYLEMHKDEAGEVEGLDGARSVAVSPDGHHVYVAGENDDAVAVFERDATTGQLTYVEVHYDVDFGVEGLDEVYSVAVSPDGDHVYVTGRADLAVAVFRRNPTSGGLTFVEVQKDGVGGVDGLNGPQSVTVSPDGEHVYVASYYGELAVFRRSATTGGLTFVEMQENGTGGVDGLDHAFSVAVSPDGDHVYVTGDVDDAVAVFERGVYRGRLSYVEMQKDDVDGVDGLYGAYSIAVSPDGHHVYATGASEHALATFGRDLTTGGLAFIEVEKDGYGGVDGLNSARSVAVSPDGDHVYVTGYGEDAVAVFSRTVSTGGLTYVGLERDGDSGVDGLDGAVSVAVSPDGHHVYVAGYDEHTVAVFSRTVSTGHLNFVEVERDGVGGVDGLLNAKSVTVSPDGAHVYVAGAADHAVAVFSRTVSTGHLTFVEVQKDGVDDVDGLLGAWSVAVSPDGRHVYVAGVAEDAVAVFSRTVSTGHLTFVEVQKDGVGGADGLNAVRSVAVSPDGHYVYVAGEDDDAVAVFSRSVITGGLTFVEMRQDGVDGVDGLDAAKSVAVSPDGRDVYVASTWDYAVAVFRQRRRWVLFDEAHDEMNTLSATRASSLNPDHPEWIYFGELVTELQDEVIFARNDAASLSYDLLVDYDLLMLSAPVSTFSSSEMAAIHMFISTGGGVVVLGEPYLTHPANAFLSEYGIAFDFPIILQPTPAFAPDFSVTNFASHPAVDGVSAFETNWSTSLLLSSGAISLAWTNTNAWQDANFNTTYDAGSDPTGSFYIAGGYDTGYGRVAAVSDNSFQDDGFEGRNNAPLMHALLYWGSNGPKRELEMVHLPLVLRGHP